MVCYACVAVAIMRPTSIEEKFLHEAMVSAKQFASKTNGCWMGKGGVQPRAMALWTNVDAPL